MDVDSFTTLVGKLTRPLLTNAIFLNTLLTQQTISNKSMFPMNLDYKSQENSIC